ncbi:hypothetical protein BASA81_002954 [Batrachochytrium salamandrivorans]|nr:hypothetical protein BASA81_002954 [Batrachochytrium salamandrivorans]
MVVGIAARVAGGGHHSPLPPFPTIVRRHPQPLKFKKPAPLEFSVNHNPHSMLKNIQASLSKQLHRSSSFSKSSSSSLSYPTSPVCTGDARLLEQALEHPGALQILLHLLPSIQDECKLRLVGAILSFKTELDPMTKTAKARKIACMFFQSGSKFEITNVPSHLVRANLLETCDTILKLELGELVRLPEVLAALGAMEPSTHGSSGSFANTSSLGFDSEGGGGGGNDETSVGVKPRGEDDFAIMSRLERIIGNSALRHRLIENVISHDLGYQDKLTTKIRFVSVVDQYLACNDTEVKQFMGKKIQVIFLDQGGMFFIPPNKQSTAALPSSSSSSLSLRGLSGWEEARVDVLADLCSHTVINALLPLFPEHA